MAEFWPTDAPQGDAAPEVQEARAAALKGAAHEKQ